MKSEYRGFRCGICYWALYDGELCQNKSCEMFGLPVDENMVRLTNDEAFTLIEIKRLESLPYGMEMIYNRGNPRADSRPSFISQLRKFLDQELK